MPSGKLSCLVSGNARLLEDVSLPATVVIDVLGSAYHASSHINGRATSQDGETQVAADTSRDLRSMYLHYDVGIWAGVWPGDGPRLYPVVCHRLFPRPRVLSLCDSERACCSLQPSVSAPFLLAGALASILSTYAIGDPAEIERWWPPAQEPQWRQELSMSLRPDDVGEGRARVSLRNSSHALVGEGVVSLDTVLAEDLDRTEVELHDHDGHSVGALGLVSFLWLLACSSKAAVPHTDTNLCAFSNAVVGSRPRSITVMLSAAVQIPRSSQTVRGMFLPRAAGTIIKLGHGLFIAGHC